MEERQRLIACPEAASRLFLLGVVETSDELHGLEWLDLGTKVVREPSD